MADAVARRGAEIVRILLVNDFSGPVYGAELHLLALRDGLRRRGHEVRVFSSRLEQAPGVRPIAEATCFGANGRFQLVSSAVNPSAALTLGRVLRGFKPDVVHVVMFLWQLSPLILPLLREAPSVYEAVMYKAVCPKGTKLLKDGRQCARPYGIACLQSQCVNPVRWAGAMVQLALVERWRSAFDRVVVPSRPMKAVMEAAGFEDLEVVPFGFALPPRRPPLQGPPLVAYAGRLSPEKGCEVLLRAFASARAAAPDARLIMAGDGPLGEDLRRLAARLGIDTAVDWLGYVSRDAMERAFAPAWVQVVPSLWQEPFGNVTAEAMLRGAAVVASDIGGARDMIEDGVTGLLTPPGDVEALAGALIRLLGRRDEVERLGEAARRRAQDELSEEVMLDRWISIYAQMTSGRPGDQAAMGARPADPAVVAAGV